MIDDSKHDNYLIKRTHNMISPTKDFLKNKKFIITF